MKNLLLITLICAVLFSCGAGRGQTDDGRIALIDSNKLKGITIAHTADKYDAYRGQYTVITMLKHIGSKRLKNLQLNAVYYNAEGKQVAQSIGGPDAELMPGDSAIIETSTVFVKDSLPNKVILTVSN